MFYIITEDEKAGLMFYKKFNEIILQGKAIVDTSKGCKNLINKLIQVGPSKDDKILIALDHVNSIDIIETIREIKRWNEEGYQIHYTKYYCMEEIFLSFKYLQKWHMGISHQNMDMLDFIQTCINNNKDYFEEPNPALKELIEGYKSSNREHFASTFLLRITKRSNFKISKVKVGDCWLTDCCSNLLPYIACYLKQDNNYLSVEQKLLSIYNNSILQNAIALNEFGYFKE